MACSVDPLVARLMKIPQMRGWRRRPGRGVVVVATFLVISLLVALLLLVIVSRLVTDLSDFQQQLPASSAALEQSATELATQFGIPPQLVSAAVGQLQSGLTNLTSVVNALLTVFGGILNVVFTVIIAVYLATDSDRLLGFGVRLLPPGQRAEGEAVLGMTGLRLGMWVRGQLVVATIISSVFWVGLTLI